MDEQICKIIRNDKANFVTSNKTAKAISSYVFEFIKWLNKTCEVTFDNRWEYYGENSEKDIHVYEIFDSKEAYKYWFNNVKNK